MKKRLLLHTCCAPCLSQSALVLTNQLSYERILDEKPDFEVIVFFDNPNIYSIEEYRKRENEVKKLISIFKKEYDKKLEFIPSDYTERRKIWLELTINYKNEPERGQRCNLCYEFRLEESFRMAKKLNLDLVATTLTLSPLKNTEKINEIGLNLSQKYNIKYLKSDFKKNNGVKNSVEFCKKYGIYRQNFCGCEYSLNHIDNL
ncbi:MAG: epoxyqueuosine reductase QueH [Brevinematia bacterium]